MIDKKKKKTLQHVETSLGVHLPQEDTVKEPVKQGSSPKWRHFEAIRFV